LRKKGGERGKRDVTILHALCPKEKKRKSEKKREKQRQPRAVIFAIKIFLSPKQKKRKKKKKRFKPRRSSSFLQEEGRRKEKGKGAPGGGVFIITLKGRGAKGKGGFLLQSS